MFYENSLFSKLLPVLAHSRFLALTRTNLSVLARTNFSALAHTNLSAFVREDDDYDDYNDDDNNYDDDDDDKDDEDDDNNDDDDDGPIHILIDKLVNRSVPLQLYSLYCIYVNLNCKLYIVEIKCLREHKH